MPHIASSIPTVYNQEQLKNVGEYLKQFLDPFGIDVSYYVDSLGRNTATADSTGAEKKETEKKPEDKPKEDEKKPAEMQVDEEPKSDKTVADAVINGNYYSYYKCEFTNRLVMIFYWF